MAKTTKIQWADSTLNLQMGCNGCELWSKKRKSCYAGVMTNVYKGRKGWPKEFERPEVFTYRLDQAEKWSDLTGTERPDKPWLNGLPRMIFLNDMGDTFTESLPLNWMEPLIERMEETPHVWLMLTKRPGRMEAFWEQYGRVPANFWIGTSVTHQKNMGRVNPLIRLKERFGAMTWISAEPMLGKLEFGSRLKRIDWLILGGESGNDARPCYLTDIKRCFVDCEEWGTAGFVKQLGAKPVGGSSMDVSLKLKDGHGGDWNEWPDFLRVRELPTFEAPPTVSHPIQGLLL